MNLEQETLEYKLALEENIDAINASLQSDIKKRKARQRLNTAREQLHFKTQDLLEQAELQRE